MKTSEISQAPNSTDVQQLTALKYRWGSIVDETVRSCSETMIAEGISLWAECARLDLGVMGVFAGFAGIEKVLRDSAQMFAWTLHVATNPLFDIGDDEALGRWNVQVYAKTAGAAAHELMLGVQKDRYVRIDGRWRLLEQTLVPME